MSHGLFICPQLRYVDGCPALILGLELLLQKSIVKNIFRIYTLLGCLPHCKLLKRTPIILLGKIQQFLLVSKGPSVRAGLKYFFMVDIGESVAFNIDISVEDISEMM